MKLGIFIVLALSCMVFNVQALTFYKLDAFLEFEEVFLTTPQTPDPDYSWWTPYYTPSIPSWVAPTEAAYVDTSSALGGQRDMIIGFEAAADPGTTAILGIAPNGRKGGCYYTLGFVGGGYWQWDGVDNVGANARPAKANPTPGIGSNPNYTYLPGHNAGGAGIDLTLGGSVKALNFEALTDLACEYTFDFFDPLNRTAKFEIDIVESDDFLPYQLLFSNLGSATSINSGWAGFSNIAAIQLVVYTFESLINAIDTEFRELNFVGYQITGSVVSDCDCNTSNGVDRSVAGQPVTLRSGTGTTPSGTVLTTVNTDSSGAFVITGTPLNSGSYQVCVETPQSGLTLCAGQTVCRRVDLTGFSDPAPLQFVLQQGQTLTPPGEAQVLCGACTDATAACTGTATLSSCAGGSIPVTTHTDSITNTQCVRTVTRTFTASGVSVTQRIIITDNAAPVLVTPASNQAPPCGNLNPTFQQWLNTFGGATWTDCTSFSVSNDASGGPTSCGTRTVTFTARDPCNNPSISTTASYSLVDNQPPVFNPDASSASAQCDVSGGTDFSQFNAWLANNGGARATDNCGNPTITNNYTPGTITRGCNVLQTVVFTATDSCGLTDTTIATFSITDATGPRITNTASNPSVTCDGTQDTQFQTWLNNHANLVASDSCTAVNLLTWSDDFPGNTVPAGCNTPTTVTFTVFDDCRQSSSATGVFTVRDTTAPVITTQPTPLVISCNSQDTNSLTAWLNNNAGARANDACTGNVAWSNNFDTVGSIGNCASTTVTFTVCDLCGTPNCRSVTSTYSIQDSEAPTYLTPPQNANAECNSQTTTLFNAWISSGANAVLTDNCSPDSIRFTNNNSGAAPFGCFAVKTVSFFAVDACGNSAAPRTATFTVEDNVAPAITTFASDRATECNPSLNQPDYQSWLSQRGGAIASDACASSVSWVNNGPSSVTLTTGCSSSVTVTFIASDGCQNTASTTGTYTIRDTQPPRITTQARDQISECTDTSANINSWLTDNGGARAVDDCSSVTWTNNFIAISGTCSAGATVTFTARDVCGQSASSTATFSINDTQPPVIVTPARSTTVACGPNVPGALATFLNTNGGAVADDACQGDDALTWTNNFSTAPPGCGFRAVTFTVTDPCNRSAQTTASFTVTDTTAPIWDPAPQDLLVECDSDNNIDYNTWLSTRAGSFAFDECAVDLSYSDNAPLTAPQRCDEVTVTFTVEDQCDNVLRGTATFTVVDTLLPVFTIPPQDLVVECDGTLSENAMNQWLNNVAGASAIDLCTPANELAYSHSTQQAPVRDVCLSSTMFTFNVVDSCGNTARDTAAFIIRDTRAPVFSRSPSDASFECDGTGNSAQIANWINTNGGAIAADACQSTIDWTTDYPGQGPSTCQSVLVTFTATDECGFRSSRTATLTVQDTQGPVFTDVPADVTLPCDALTDPDYLGYPTATDACAGDLIVFFTDSESDLPAVGNCPGNHLILRTFLAVDECANRVEVSQLITVVIARSSGPCDPGDCDCECCPPAAPSQCIAANCRATDCRAVPCSSSVCTCVEDTQNSVVVANNGVTVRNVEMNDESEMQQCKPVYIYVHDDDDEHVDDVKEAGVSQQRILVSNQLIERFAKSGASSVAPLLFVILSLLFVLF